MHFTVLDIPTFRDSRGALAVLDGVLPFEIRRTYWIYGADSQERGGHRHHVTRQALVAIAGSVSVYMNDGIEEKTIVLNSPDRCLLVEPKDWHTMTFGAGAILLVLSSHPYEKSDYIEAKYG